MQHEEWETLGNNYNALSYRNRSGTIVMDWREDAQEEIDDTQEGMDGAQKKRWCTKGYG